MKHGLEAGTGEPSYWSIVNVYADVAIGVPEVDAARATGRAADDPDPSAVSGEDPRVAPTALPHKAVLAGRPEGLPRFLRSGAGDEVRLGCRGFAQPLVESMASNGVVILSNYEDVVIDLHGGDHASAAGVVMIERALPRASREVKDVNAGLEFTHPSMMADWSDGCFEIR